MTGPPTPSAPAWGYVNRTVHARYTPFKRAFAYRVFHLMLDVDRVEDAARNLRLFSFNGPGVFSFRERDHGPKDGGPLRPWVEGLLAEQGVRLEGGRILLLCFPRMLGFVFNPLSVFFGFGPDGDLRGAIYEVANTFGESHCYVAAMPEAAHSGAKAFYVSPFFDVTGDYRFSLRVPDERFSLRVENRVDGALTHLATLSGVRVRLSDWRLLRVLFGMPFMTVGVVAAIHWEAFWLWVKGAGYRRKPPPPSQRASPTRPDPAAAPPRRRFLRPTG